MIVGTGNFVGGETQKERVRLEDGRRLRDCAGYDVSTGAALPDKLPTRVSTTGLGGTIPQQVPIAFRDKNGVRIICRDGDGAVRVMGTDGAWSATKYMKCFGVWKHCSFAGPSNLITVDPGHGYSDSNAVVFATTTGGITAGTTYYVRDSDATRFSVALTVGGAVIDLTSSDYNDVALLNTVLASVIADATPVRVGPLVVFPTQGADAKLVAFEPDSATTTTRPASFKGPLDYDEDNRPAITTGSHPATQLFNIGTWASPGNGCGETNYTDYAALNMIGPDPGPVCAPSTKAFTCALAASVDASSMKYLVMDFVFKYVGKDPTETIVKGGEFINGDQTALASGLELVLYSDAACTTEITRYAIPQLSTDGNVNRIVFHLGTMPSTTIWGVGIDTASYFVSPTGTNSYTLWVYSFDFDSTGKWEHRGNFLLPAVVFGDSPWADGLPSDPGTKSSGTTLPTSAVVLETFPESYANFTPDHPLLAYQYQYRGRDALSTDEYHQMISGSSLESIAILADPWLSYTIAISSDDDANNNNVEDEYGDYFTHQLLYRSIYSGLGEDEDTGELGTWSSPTLAGTVTSTDSTYTDSKREDVACTMVNSGDTVTCTAHLLNVGDTITFGSTTGNVVVDQEYCVIATSDANTFQFSVDPGGTAFTITADGANTWTKTGVAAELDGHDIPEIMETNHDYADSAKYVVAGDARLYSAVQTYDNTNSEWDRPLQICASNFEDFASWPTTPGDDTIETDGSELGEFSPHSAEIRGMLVKDDLKFVGTDNGFSELVGQMSGNSPYDGGGWRFLRRDAIGWVSNRTAADCRSQIIWHDGGHFYSYAGSRAEPISEGLIDSTLIDFTAAHGFVFSKERYVGFCNYADTSKSTNWCLMIYTLPTEARPGHWRRRHSTGYQLAGICVVDASGTVYGLTHDGDVINVFGGTTDYGSGAVTYTIGTQYMKVADTGQERHTHHLVLEAVTSQSSLSVTFDFYVQGRLNASATAKTLTLVSTRTKYGPGDLNVDLLGDAVRIVMTYTGAYPPDVYYLGVALGDSPVEVG